MDPLMIQAIINRESRGDVNMITPDDNGTADYGIMQVNTVNKRPETYDWRDPVQNITAGVHEYAAAVRHYHGDLHRALHAYNGFGQPSSYYADPVYQDYLRLKAGASKQK